MNKREVKISGGVWDDASGTFVPSTAVRQLMDLIDGDCTPGQRLLAAELLRTFPDEVIREAGHAVLTDRRAVDAVILGMMG